MNRRVRKFLTALVFVCASSAFGAPPTDARSLRICATVPSLGSLARSVAGPDATITVFAKGTEDAHYLEPKMSFVTSLASADLLLTVGMDMEIGWLPALLKSARNPNVTPGGKGHVDASTPISPLAIPAGTADRSMGDLHTQGNPHYLTDPLNGLRVAAQIRDALVDLQPERRAEFERNFSSFRDSMGAAMVGKTLANKYDFEKIVELRDLGRLSSFLASQGEAGSVGGWLGRTEALRGTKAVDDHPIWAYFGRRFGLSIIAHMEPKPGIPPTTRHLRRVVERMRSEGASLILVAPYYDTRHARFLAEHTGAKILLMATEVGSRPGTDSYLEMLDYNVRQVVSAPSGDLTD